MTHYIQFKERRCGSVICVLATLLCAVLCGCARSSDAEEPVEVDFW